jgi:hypothetical protein
MVCRTVLGLPGLPGFSSCQGRSEKSKTSYTPTQCLILLEKVPTHEGSRVYHRVSRENLGTATAFVAR